MTDITSVDKALSATELKGEIGRNSFFRTKHSGGGKGNPTEYTAVRRLEAVNRKEFTFLEKLRLRNDNPSLFNALKGAGWSDEQIYDRLNNL